MTQKSFKTELLSLSSCGYQLIIQYFKTYYVNRAGTCTHTVDITHVHVLFANMHTEKWAKCYRHFTMLIQILICILRGKVVLVHVFIAYMHSVIALHLLIHTFTYTYIITSFYNQLKTVHLNGKVNRRVDFLLHHLMKYEKDMFFNYKRVHQLLPAMGDRMN